jgi:phosphoglycerol transferase MdoB-like AlkP superfamily enzyme
MSQSASPAMTKLRNLFVAALCTLAVLQLARLIFIWQFGSLDVLGTAAGRDSFYVGLKFDLRLVAIIFSAPWLLLHLGSEHPNSITRARRWLGAAILSLALVVFLCVVIIGMVDDRAGRPWLIAFLLLAGLHQWQCKDYGLASGREVHWIWVGYSIVVASFVLASYAADFGSYSYNQVRLNGTVLGFLQNPLTSAHMVWQSYPVIRGAVLFGVVLVAMVWGLRRLRGWHPMRTSSHWLRWSINVAVSFLLVLLMWGKESRYPLRWGEVFDGRDRFVAHAALNPVLFFLETRVTPDAKMDMSEVNATHQAMADYFGIPKNYNAQGEPTLLRTIKPNPLVSGTPNVVLIQIESLSAYKTSMLGNRLDPTPFLKQLADKSIFFDNFHVVMQNTSRSMFATLFGIADVSGLEGNATRNPLLVDQHCLLNYLTDYDKYYFLGGNANWAQIRAAFKNNIAGLNIYEEGSYAAPVVDVWGVADVDMMLEGGETMLKKAKRPYLAYFQTSGNHEPYTIPSHLKDFKPAEFPQSELAAANFENIAEFNAVRLMDYSVQKFIEAQAQTPEYLNTVYILWADHGMPRGNTDPRFAPLYLANHHIPLLIYAPGFIKEGRRVPTSGSQLDILPTLMSLLGREVQTQTLGKDLLDPNIADKSGAFIFSTWERPPVLGFIQGQNYLIKHPTGKSFLYDLQTPQEIDHTTEQPQKAEELSNLAHGFNVWSRYLMEHNKPLLDRPLVDRPLVAQ